MPGVKIPIFGLSPRVRGNHMLHQGAGGGVRSIPACAGEPHTPAYGGPAHAVYPRVCGGTARSRGWGDCWQGLSPRVRGNRRGRAAAAICPGSIPACAGEPHSARGRRNWAEVYPRVCGGTPFCPRPPELGRGLSPRVRGNRVGGVGGAGRAGSIPACAGEPGRAARPPFWAEVYPRVCGGTRRRLRNCPRPPGLSPRVRGNPGNAVGTARRRRSIPACAGEPSSEGGAGNLPRVYPRVCGGTLPGKSGPGLLMGLSPRVRGNRGQARRQWRWPGSIPACAGEPRGFQGAVLFIGVYPRVCGGTRPLWRQGGQKVGLSPRVRGNHLYRADQRNRHRSIPACAGEPPTPLPRPPAPTVYPRVCGGTSESRQGLRRPHGLSPRVRGNRDGAGCRAEQSRAGSIPACAGEPESDPQRKRRLEVYPRVCGGTRIMGAQGHIVAGLSPRVRGNRPGGVGRRRRRGSIPACAGEPPGSRAARTSAAVYPRVCGGTGVIGAVPPAPHGLSPRVRGNLHGAALHWRQTRSIPACAGEPARPRGRGNLPRVYPRVCGGTRGRGVGAYPAVGLSPRVRGNLGGFTGGVVGTRSIPACAGEPAGLIPPRGRGRVYPRVCGGTIRQANFPHFPHGLSPRVRGNLRVSEQDGVTRGSIPACAGEPGTIEDYYDDDEVYPRVCGGTCRAGHYSHMCRGLSPRVRGNLLPPPEYGRRVGSIPACAGEPARPRGRGNLGRVYPRVCGGTSSGLLAIHGGRGLSPRVRGNRRGRAAAAICPGSIPACAGEPAGLPARLA